VIENFPVCWGRERERRMGGGRRLALSFAKSRNQKCGICTHSFMSSIFAHSYSLAWSVHGL
jgi:hypothetical protein